MGFTCHSGLTFFLANQRASVIANLIYLVDTDDLYRDIILGAALDRHIDEVLTGRIGRFTKDGFTNLAVGYATMDAIAALHDDIPFVHSCFIEVHLDGWILTNEPGQHRTHFAGGSIMFREQAHLHLHSDVRMIRGESFYPSLMNQIGAAVAHMAHEHLIIPKQ